MTALDRLRRQIDDLTIRYVDRDVDDRPLMQQLLYLGPHLTSGQGVVGKTQPTSKPPGNLNARQLHDRILGEATAWAWTLGGSRIRTDRSLTLIPVLAQQRVDSGDSDQTKILYGRTGLYADAANWHLSIRILMGYDQAAARYPTAICPHCQQHQIRARETLAWCANPTCRDEHGRRREFSILYLQDLLRSATHVELAHVRGED